MISKQGDRLYAAITTEISSHLTEDLNTKVIPLLIASNAKSTSNNIPNFLKVISDVFKDHSTCMIMIRDILMYMDRTHLKGNDKPLIYDLGLHLFRDVILNPISYPVQDIIIQTLLVQIRNERLGNQIDQTILKIIGTLFTTISNGYQEKSNIYDGVFLPLFLESTRHFYSEESILMMQDLDPIDYLIKVIKLICKQLIIIRLI